MTKILNLSALLVFFAAASVAAHADTYNYIIIANAANNDPASSFTASGTLSGAVDPYDSSAVDVTSITGSANGYDFLGVVDPGVTNSQTPATEFGFTFDNVLFPANGTQHADTDGFLLYLDSPLGTSLAHVFYTGITTDNPGGYEVDVVDPNEPGASTPFGIATPFSVRRFSITRAVPAVVPEPATFGLLGTGLIGLVGLGRRRFAR